MMNNHQQQNDLYYENSLSRSPGSHRHQQNMLQQPNRHYDAYGSMPTNNIYGPEETNMRYEGRFDRVNGQPSGLGYAYESPQQSQTWNPNAFSTPNGFSSYQATGRMKSQSRGRSALPNVRPQSCDHVIVVFGGRS